MNPQYVRIILPSNKNIQLLTPLLQSKLQNPQPIVPAQIQLVNTNTSAGTPSAVPSTLEANAVSRLPLSSLNTNQHISQQVRSPMTVISSSQQPPQITSSGGSATSENNFIQYDSISNIDKTSTEVTSFSPSSMPMKRHHSSCCEMEKTFMNKSIAKSENEENYQKKFKRGKNWSEEETTTFINIWSDHYAKLMGGGARNTPIYNSMAQQLNQLLSPRVMTGADVKAKISNLVAEYRKKKKEQGKTGASPSPWPYYDQIDKLLGERPYNDESLMSDSISLRQEQLLEEMENTSVSTSNLNSSSEEADDNTPNLMKDVEECTNNSDSRSCTSKSPSSSTSTQKNTTMNMNTPDISIKKSLSSKKKRVADMRIDLMQQMISKIDGANEMASRAETKALVLLEKQTKLQEESLNNEKEFLNVFRSIANNLNSSR